MRIQAVYAAPSQFTCFIHRTLSFLLFPPLPSALITSPIARDLIPDFLLDALRTFFSRANICADFVTGSFCLNLRSMLPAQCLCNSQSELRSQKTGDDGEDRRSRSSGYVDTFLHDAGLARPANLADEEQG